MRQVMVRYKVKPDRAAENEELVRAVYEELQRTAPAGLRYATFRARGRRQLRPRRRSSRGRAQPADARWRRSRASRRASRDRCDEAAGRSRELHEVGSYRFMAMRAARCHRVVPPGAAHRRPPSARARSTRELLRWRTERIDAGCAAPTTRSGWAAASAAGSSSAPTRRPVWLPYVEVERVDEVTDRARRLGASVLLEPREGPAGWRSVVATPEGGEIAFWQPKARRSGWGAA